MVKLSMMKKVLLGMVASLLLAACGSEREPAEPAVDIDAGKVFAENNCSGCHNPDGGGKTAEIPNLAGQPADYLADAMHAYRDGRRRHDALQEMITECTEADIRNMAAYFASLTPLPPAPAAGSRGWGWPDRAAAASRDPRPH